MTKGNVVQVGDVITGFKVKVKNTPNETRCVGNYVVEEVVKEADGFGHGPHDVYPGGYKITARKLNEAGEYDPNGEVVYPRTQAGGSIGNNTEIEVVGKMKRSLKFTA